MQIHSRSKIMVRVIKALIKIVPNKLCFDGIVEKWNSVLKAIMNIYSADSRVGLLKAFFFFGFFMVDFVFKKATGVMADKRA